jgi:hypothetical protein
MSGNAYRVLALDGGGPWTVIQAKALGRLFGPDTKGREILASFDLVAGTSGGSVITACLACDFTPAQIFDLLNTERIRRLFFQDTWYAPFTRLIGLGPRYRSDKKIEGMRSFLDPAVLGRSLTSLPASLGVATQFLITAFDYDRQRAVFFRSNAASLAGSPPATSSNVSLEQAIHASSEAPLNYFDAPAVLEIAVGDGTEKRRYWDGALTGCDNPVFAAVIEALANRQPRERIQALSIGTGSIQLPMEDKDIHPPWARHLPTRGIPYDLKTAVGAILDDPPDVATFHAYVALGQPLPQPKSVPISVVRMNPLIQPAWDDAAHKWRPRSDMSEREFDALVKTDLDALRQDQIDRISRFCDLWLLDSIWNQPIRAGANLSCDVGHRTFSQALAAWNSLPTVIERAA